MRCLLRGFTLTEIIVVVAIVSLLASAGGLVAYQGAREKARDTQRHNDLERIALATEAYRQEYGRYPDCNTGITIEPGGVAKDGGNQTCADGAAYLTHLQSFFGELPHDPLGPGNLDYFYYYDLHLCQSLTGDTAAVMVFAANMERRLTNNSEVCGIPAGNDGGFLNTTQYGGTKNPSAPYVLILGRY